MIFTTISFITAIQTITVPITSLGVTYTFLVRVATAFKLI